MMGCGDQCLVVRGVKPDGWPLEERSRKGAEAGRSSREKGWQPGRHSADVGHRNRSTSQLFDPSLAAGWRLCGTRADHAHPTERYRSTKPSTAARETGRRLFLLRQLLILQCHPRPEQRPLDGRHAAVRLVEHSQSMGGLPRRSHVHQPGRIRIRIGGSPMVT